MYFSAPVTVFKKSHDRKKQVAIRSQSVQVATQEWEFKQSGSKASYFYKNSLSADPNETVITEDTNL